MTSAPQLKPFVTVFRPSSRRIGEISPMSEFEKLFEKWKRRQHYRRNLEGGGRYVWLNSSDKHSTITKSCTPSPGSTRMRIEAKYEPFDYQSHPKVLVVKPMPIVMKKTPKKPKAIAAHGLPSIALRPTVASLARR
jgi:hypothetical protein